MANMPRPILWLGALPCLATGFSLAFVRLPPSPNSGINWVTKQAIPNAQALDTCFSVPFQYFDIAQFVPDNLTPDFLKKYPVQKVYDPRQNLYWLAFPGITVTKVEFYTGTDCKNAIYEQDQEGFLKQSTVKAEKLRQSLMNKPLIKKRPSVDIPTRLDVPMIKRPQVYQEAMEIEEDYYKDFDIEFPESENVETEIEPLGITETEQMSIEPPVAGESKEEEISRQERNFLRFYGDTESDGGVALDNTFSTLNWKENWRSFKFSYVQSGSNNFRYKE
ncbi:hypothetical protein ABW20_dc0104278 [Dactylellina cionopaga]|nr:hypothetical protein ABW20_dc0104278 [Dactylellina cionopaga]